jgi:peptidoglycan/LPS O-acetylase OafA/YrhL
MSTPSSESGPDLRRVVALDGLRGLAALIVVIGHTIGAVRQPPGIAAPSVMLFFVLSGYCLAASALRGDRLVDRGQFYIRRLFRIHPPFVFALVIAWGISLISRSGPCCDGLSDWVLRYTHLTLTPEGLSRYLFFPGTAGDLMPVGWTLEVEMVFSLLLPLMVLIARDGHWVIALALSIWALFQAEPAYVGQVYAIHFVVGILVYEASGRLANLAKRAPQLIPAGVLIMSFYFTAIGLGLVPAHWNIFGWMGMPNQPAVFMFAFALSSAALTIGAVHWPGFRRTLEWGPIAFLGRLSYSVYLLHFTVLLVALRFVTERLTDLQAVGLIAGVIIVTIAGATGMQRWIEIPSIRLGNWLCARLAHSAHTQERLSRIVDSEKSEGRVSST